MKRRRPHQHKRRLKKKTITVNRGVKKRVKHPQSLDTMIRRSSFKILEELGKNKKKALMDKEDVESFFKDWPKYKAKTKGLKKISLLENREESIKLNPDAKTAPGMYIPKEKEIRIFPIEPIDIPDEDKERAEKFYDSKEQFPAVLPHELHHHKKMPKKLRDFFNMPDVQQKKVLPWDKLQIDISKEKQETLAREAEDEWLKKMRKRKGESK